MIARELWNKVALSRGLCHEFKTFFYSGHTALQAASQNGHLEVLRLLLRSGANLELEVNIVYSNWPYLTFVW